MRTEERQAETDRARRIYDRIAPHYDQLSRCFERLLYGGGREWVTSRAHGCVLEIGVGTGRNLPLYPRDVQVIGIDVSAGMLQVAKERAADLGVGADLRLGDAQALDFFDDTFDTVVSTLALGSIPDERCAVAEAQRVLRPGGRLLLLEHVRSPNPVIRAGQWIFDPLFVRFHADHLLREPADAIAHAGLELMQQHRSRWGIVELLEARKPE
jgi:ubiquinone/menaquinone biosynthesis C-methylase UbiE